MVDAADHGKLDMARNELRNLLEKPILAGIPVLVLGNKNDLSNAVTAEQLIEKLYQLIFLPTFSLNLFDLGASPLSQHRRYLVTPFRPRIKSTLT